VRHTPGMKARAAVALMCLVALGAAAAAGAVHGSSTRVTWGAASAHPVRHGGVMLAWQTRTERANVGFDLYRARKARPRRKAKLTERPVAGTVLSVGVTATRRSRTSYRWFDEAGKRGDRYWIRDVDVSGRRRWHGPFTVKGHPVKRRPSSSLVPVGSGGGGAVPTPVSGTPTNPVPSPTPYPTIDEGADVDAELAGRQTVRVDVDSDGWTQMALDDLTLLGANTSVPANLHVFTGGREIPTTISDKYVSFYGRAVDTPDTATRTYIVDSQNLPGLRNQSTPEDPNAPEAAAATDAVGVARPRLVYFSALSNGGGNNFFGPVITSAGATQGVNAFGLKSPAGAALSVTLQGVGLVEHSVDVTLNGQAVGTIAFSGRDAPTRTFADVPAVAGVNAVTLTSSRANDVSLLDEVALTYTRTLEPQADALDLTVPGGRRSTVGPFTTTGAMVLDVTNPDAPTRAAASGDESVSFTAAGPGVRSLFAFAPGAAKAPAAYAVGYPSALKTTEHDGRLTIITRARFLDALQPLIDRRRAQGLSVAVVQVQDIYDEFSHGQAEHDAIGRFLDYARANWRTPPQYVLLGGDGTHDPRGFLGGDANADQVPVQPIATGYGEAFSDSTLTGTLATGRLPARTAAAMQQLVSKILTYEDAAPVANAVLANDLSKTAPFAKDTDDLRPLLPPSWTVTRVDRDTQDDARARLLAGLSAGPSLVDYLGHGSVDLWAGNLLKAADANDLTNTDHPSFYVLMTCLNGYFTDPLLDSLAEKLLAASGGAAAVFSSTAQATPQPQVAANRALLSAIYGGSALPRAGDAIASALSGVGDADVRASWTLLGDPTMPLH
jgi:hypothetical protein